MGSETPSAPRFFNENFYGGAGAISFNLGLAKDNRTPAIHVDCAVIQPAGPAGRAFADWKNKSSMMLSMGEATTVLGACLGLTGGKQPLFDFHGDARNKSLSLVWRDGVLYINFTHAGDRIGVPLQQHHRIQLANFILTHYLQKLAPGRSQAEWLHLIKLSVGPNPSE